MVNPQQISTAWDQIRPHVLRTPVVQTDVFGVPLSFKLEHMQHTGSFKARGAMNSLLSMDRAPRRFGGSQWRQSWRGGGLGSSALGP